MTAIILFLTLSLKLLAPEDRTMIIPKPEKIHPTDKMLIAFMKVESNFNTKIVNSLGYTGILQLGSEMIEEANRICKIQKYPHRFTMCDALDSTRSVQIWYLVQAYRNPKYELKRACIIWNPLASPEYLKRIKTQLN